VKPFIVPIFIPSQGCPHRCIFCRQEKITASPEQIPTSSTIVKTVERAMSSPTFQSRSVREIAFYGGTFTNLSVKKISELLDAVQPYLGKEAFRGVRVSTRPDALDPKRLDLMRGKGVDCVELGVQSLDDHVLEISKRGYGAGDIGVAVSMLRNRSFRVGIQLMPGLPGDVEDRFMETVEGVVRLRPDMVRLYPSLVIRGTELARWYENGHYEPLSLRCAVGMCARACMRLEEEGIPVIRIGLMSSPSLIRDGEILAGPWHEAFGFLVRSAIYRERIIPDLRGLRLEGRKRPTQVRIHVPPREIPLVRGHRNEGLKDLEKRSGMEIIGVLPDDSMPPGGFSVEEED
jgi:histone acetyltransferase (RNA polymerase elongator complex component)